MAIIKVFLLLFLQKKKAGFGAAAPIYKAAVPIYAYCEAAARLSVVSTICIVTASKNGIEVMATEKPRRLCAGVAEGSLFSILKSMNNMSPAMAIIVNSMFIIL